MQFSHQLVALVAATPVTASLASPVQTFGKNVDCNGPKTVMSPNYGNELKIDNYLTCWKAKKLPGSL